MRGTKYSFEVVKHEFEKRGYELLETEYVSNTTRMRYICPEHRDKELNIMFKSLLKGNGCRYCGAERSNEANRQYNYNDAIKEFSKLGYKLLNNNYENVNTPLKYICPNHPEKINETPLTKILSGTRCKWCVWESRRGENNYNWNGGVTEIKGLLRERINSWKMEALERTNYKCDVTGFSLRGLEVHHTKPFHIIRDEVSKELGLKSVENVSDYTKEELDAFVTLFGKKHKEVLGVPIHKELHKLFHKLYGFDTTVNDYFEFKQRFKNGEFYVKSVDEWKKKTTNLAQQKNKKPMVIHKGSSVSLAEASRITGVSINTLYERYKRGDRGERLFRKVKGLGCSKLTNNQVSEIKEMLKQSVKQTTIAKKFGVAESTITNIKKESTRKYKQIKGVFT